MTHQIPRIVALSFPPVHHLDMQNLYVHRCIITSQLYLSLWLRALPFMGRRFLSDKMNIHAMERLNLAIPMLDEFEGLVEQVIVAKKVCAADRNRTGPRWPKGYDMLRHAHIALLTKCSSYLRNAESDVWAIPVATNYRTMSILQQEVALKGGSVRYYHRIKRRMMSNVLYLDVADGRPEHVPYTYAPEVHYNGYIESACIPDIDER
jgi:hypothetical protein